VDENRGYSRGEQWAHFGKVLGLCAAGIVLPAILNGLLNGASVTRVWSAIDFEMRDGVKVIAAFVALSGIWAMSWPFERRRQKFLADMAVDKRRGRT
jgi:hypothetical protein